MQPDCPRDRCNWKHTPPGRSSLHRVVLPSIPLETITLSGASPVVFKGRSGGGTLSLEPLQKLFPSLLSSFAVVEERNQLHYGPRLGCCEERSRICEKEVGVVLHQRIVIANARIIALSSRSVIGQKSEVKAIVWEKHTLWIRRDECGNMNRIQRIDHGDPSYQYSQKKTRERELLLGILNRFKNAATVHEIGAAGSTDDYIIASSAT